MTVDYIIVGQGICGSFLSKDLLTAGKSILVIDEELPHTASKVASGVINPITGRRMVRTWEIEKLMPFAVEAYHLFGEALQLPVIRQCNILDFHPTPQMVLAFAERQPIEIEYLKYPTDIDLWRTYFNFDFSIGEIDPCWLIDLQKLIPACRKKLDDLGVLRSEKFDWSDCRIKEHEVTYQDVTAEKIIFSDGVAGYDNPYFHLLPYAKNKGEVIIASIPELPRNHIFKQGINLVPWQEDLWWIGSNYDWDYTSLTPSPDFRNKVTSQLNQWLKMPITIIDHITSERPANMERRPFVGLHPRFPSVGIFNGMGTKGCSLAPYFSNEFANFLVQGAPLTPQADVRRFSKILSTIK